MLLFNSRRELKRNLRAYTEAGRHTFEAFERGAIAFGAGDDEALETSANRAHEHENICDRLRRRIELDLFERALLPETREDLMEILEHLDLVVNQAKDMTRRMQIEHPRLPAAMRTSFSELAALARESGLLSMVLAWEAIHGRSAARGLVDAIKQAETRADEVEQAIKRAVFDADWDTAEKLLARDLVEGVSAVCDRAEDAAGRILIFLAKRRL